MGQVRREWTRSDGNGPGQTGMDQVRWEWIGQMGMDRSDGNGLGQMGMGQVRREWIGQMGMDRSDENG